MSTRSDRPRLYLSAPHMSEEGYELEFVREAFESNWIAPVGPHITAFEKEFAAYVGLEHAAGVASGTAALHLALILADVGPGDEVYCSSFTFAASANPIRYLGAEPVFIDSEAKTWNMDAALLEAELDRAAKAGKLPKAVIAVDVCGQIADFDPIVEACRKYDVTLIEDAAEALGATYNGRSAGSFGDMSIFSFNGNKVITTSGGGMFLSKRGEDVERVRFLATQARDPAVHYEHSHIGYNYRMSNILAGIGRGQLRVLDRRVKRRREIFARYTEGLSGVPGIGFMPEPEGFYSTHWLSVVTIDPEEYGSDWKVVLEKLEERNIETRPLWKPMHMQPVFSECRIVGGAVCENLFGTGLCLPSWTAMTDEQQDEVIEVIRATGK